jgi:hypothetical protein
LGKDFRERVLWREDERSGRLQGGGMDAAGDAGWNQTGSGDQSGQGEEVSAFHGEVRNMTRWITT